MKKRLLAIVLILGMLFSLIVPVYSESQFYEVSWIRCQGTELMDYAADIQETREGEIVATGYVNNSSIGSLTNDLWVGKYSADGDQIWYTRLGGSGDDRGVAVSQVSDGFLVVGFTQSDDLSSEDGYHGMGDYWIIKLNNDGLKVWSKCLGGTGVDQPSSILPVVNDGLVIAGSSNSNDEDISDQQYFGNDFWVVQIDATGNITWENSFGGNGDDRASSITKGTDSGYLVAGLTNSIDGLVTNKTIPYDSDSWFVKIDDNGRFTWEKCLAAPAHEQTLSIERTPDGGYVSIRSAYGSVFVEKYDQLINNILWTRPFDGYFAGSPSDIIQLSNGDCIATASQQIMHLDSTGNLIQTLLLNAYSYSTTIISLCQSAVGGAILAGHTQDNNLPNYQGGSDIALTRLGIPQNISFASPQLKQELLNRGFDMNQDNDISQAEALRIRQLYLYNLTESDLSGLEYAENLESFSIAGFAGNDLSPLSALSRLTYLSLERCGNISNLNAISGLTSLRTLNIQVCPSLSGFDSLIQLVNLETLNIGNCWQLADLNFMSGMNQLQSANLNYNSIRDISGLQNIINLSSLSLSHNQITNIAPLKNLNNLSFLDLQYNNIADIYTFSYMTTPRIQVLNLSINPVDDLTPLLDLSALSELMIYTDPDVLNVSSDPDNMQIIRQLADRNVGVYFNSVNYQTYIQDTGLQSLRFNGELAGDPNLVKPIQGFSANLVLEQMNESVGKIEYKADFRDLGWTYWTSGNLLGAPSDIIEGLAFRLTNFSALNYDIYYRVYAENFGWLDWASNGQPAGTYGYGYPIVAVEIQLATKGSLPPGNTSSPYMINSDIIYYTVHFNSQGGSLVNDVEVEANTKLIEPVPPNLDGHIFEGWFKDSGCLNVWDFSQDFITADTTLYAKWSMKPDFTNGVAIYSYPTDLIYQYGDELALEGGSIIISKGDGSTLIVPMTSDQVSVSGYSSTQLGTQVLTVTYDGKSTYYSVEVLPLPNESVTQITVSGLNGLNKVPVNSTLQMAAEVLPVYATNPAVAWSVKRGTGSAVISSSGMLTGTKAGTVTVTATATDGSGVYGSKVIMVMVPVTGISVTGVNSVSVIEVNKTLQMNAAVLPSSATYKTVTWSVIPGTGSASISSTGLLEGLTEGTVMVVATATDGTGITGQCEITIKPVQQTILVNNITVSSSSGATTLKVRASLQMIALVQPQNANNKDVTWSVVYGSGQAKITPAGLLTGTRAGTVTIVAKAVDGSGVQGSIIITIIK